MEIIDYNDLKIPVDLKESIQFHGHLCPGLVYGYRVAREAAKRLNISKSTDEEVVAICENDSCSVDAFQIILGTTSGKGNLIINNYGKNVYTVISRRTKKALRFSRIFSYTYEGEHPEDFQELEKAVSEKKASLEQSKRQKLLKSIDLANKSFEKIFKVEEVVFAEPPYAPLAPSKACAKCGELTMQSKMIIDEKNNLFCIPCSEDNS